MRHIAVTSKKDQKVLIHVEDLIECFPAADSVHSICIIRVADRDKGETYLLVKESTNQIHEKLRELSYERRTEAKRGE